MDLCQKYNFQTMKTRKNLQNFIFDPETGDEFDKEIQRIILRKYQRSFQRLEGETNSENLFLQTSDCSVLDGLLRMADSDGDEENWLNAILN
eukprot:Awhi_evm1s11136